MKYIATLLFILIFSKAHGESPLWHLEGNHNTTSDNLRLHGLSLHYLNHKRDLSWPYKNEATQAWDYGLLLNDYRGSSGTTKFEGNQLEAIGGRKFSKNIHLQLQLGTHILERKSDGQKFDRLSGEILLDGYLFARQDLYARYDYRNDFAYFDLALPKGIETPLSKGEHSFELVVTSLKMWRFVYDSQFVEFSDNNLRIHNQIQTLYGLSPSWPWIWAGAVAEHIENSKTIAGYWTPHEFTSAGLKLEASFPIHGQLTGMSEIQYRLQQENGLPWGDGNSFYFGVQHGDRDGLNFRVGYSLINSLQEGSKWQEETLSFSMSK